MPLATLALPVDGVQLRLPIVALDGREALSSLFEFDLTLLADDASLDDVDVTGERVTLELDYGARSRTIHGIVRSFEKGESTEFVSTYRVTLSPSAYLLALREDCRVFQGRTAPEIIESVVTAAGFSSTDYRLSLHGAYLPREHAIQYRETDWSFLRRVLESEGIFCFFDHAADREVLVFADDTSAYRRMSGPEELPFWRQGSGHRDGERVRRFRHTKELRAGKVELRGHDFRSPQGLLESRAESGTTAIAIHDAPPAFDTYERGDRLARLRLAQETTRGGSARATSDSLGIEPGVVFRLTEHGVDALNRDWLVTSAEHRITPREDDDTYADIDSMAGGHYENELSCIPADVPFRSTATTEKPRMGIQTAVVVGPPGQEVHCDELGRVKVQFHWDREGQNDDRSSSWLRVSQAWAGAGYGAMFVPRVGNQVLVDFADGDPDRPIIVGSVYDAKNLPPLALPQSRTATTFRTSSSPGDGDHSELLFDDQRGQEYVALRSSRDLTVGVARDKDESVARNESLQVGGDREKTVSGTEATRVGVMRTIDVGGGQSTNIGLDESVTVGGGQNTIVGGARSVEVGGIDALIVVGQKTEVIGEGLKLRVGGDRTEKIIGSSRHSTEGDHDTEAARYSLDVSERIRTTVSGDHEDHADGARRIHAGELVELVCGEATITAHKDGSVTLIGKNVRLKVAGPVEIEGDSLSVRSQGAVNVNAGGSVKVRGRSVKLN